MKIGPPITIDESNFTINVPMYAPTLWQSNGGSFGGWAEGEIIFYDDNPVLQRDYSTAYRALANTTSTGQPDDTPLVWERAPEWDRWTSGASFDEEETCLYAELATIGGNDVPTGRFDIYRSLVNANTGNDPTGNPDKWQFQATVYWPWKRYFNYSVYGGEAGKVAYNRRVYRGLTTGGNSNKIPATETDYWLDLDTPVNAWALLDNKTSTQTVYPDDIIITVDLDDYVDTLTLLDVDATYVNVTIMDGMDEVYNVNFQMIDDTGVVDWWAYWYAPILSRRTLVVTDLPSILNGKVIVTITNGDGVNRAVGYFGLTNLIEVGGTQYGARIGYDDYSVFQTDEFGNRYIVQRGYSNWGQFSVWVEKAYVDSVMKVLRDNRATPCLFVASEAYDSTIYFGVPRNVEMSISFPRHSVLELRVEGF